jgi:predicted transcriptional regulator
MYKAYLSYAQLKEYLAVLIESNLLEFEKGTQSYRTTSKGMQFLKTYTQIGGLIVSGPEEK